MRRLALAAAGLLSLAACDQLAAPTARPAAYEPTIAGTVDHALCLLGFSGAPLERLVTGHHLISGELNGRPARFILDTGANATVIHAAHAEAFGLSDRTRPGVAVGLGGSLRASQAGIESLTLADVPIRQDTIMVADLSQLDGLLGRIGGGVIHGIVGQDVMAEHRAVVDVARPMLHLQAEDADPAPVPAEGCAASENPGAGGVSAEASPEADE